MMAKDSVKRRLEGDAGMSFTEFSYQLVQGYDFYYLWKHKNCVLQMGGSDQWGNMVTGTELIRRKEAGTAFALTTQLIKKADGTKFGKTEGGNIWLDATKTSPYKFYQFWINISDEDAQSYIKIFTLKSQETIKELIDQHQQAPHLRILQKALADDITQRVHSTKDLEMAIQTSNFLFANGSLDFLSNASHHQVLDIFDGLPQFTIAREQIQYTINIIELLAEKTQIFSSKSEAKKMIQGGGIAIQRQKITDIDARVGLHELINERYLIVQKGKKNYFLITVA